MNREQIKRGYDRMTPDSAARQRMLQQILEEAAGKVSKEYFAKYVKNDSWKNIAAAVLVLMVIFGGLTTVLLQQQNNQLDNEQTTGTTNALLEYPEANMDWGVTLIPSLVSRTGAKAVFRNTGIVTEGVLTYDAYMILERYEKDKWVEVIHSGHSWEDLTLYVENGIGESYSWENSYGELPDGRYRMGITITLTLPDGIAFDRVIYGEFSLPGSICSGAVPLEDLPKDYSWEQAVMDGCFVQMNGKASGNNDVFYTFTGPLVNNQPKSIRIVHIFNQDENFTTVYDLSYDGNVYTISWLENGKRQTKEYRYLRQLVDYPKSENATFSFAEHYVLLNDDSTLTWNDLWQSLASSKYCSAIDHITIFSRYEGDSPYEVDHQAIKQIDLEFQGEILYTSADPEVCEKISLLAYEMEYLSYPPNSHNIGIGLNMILTLETGQTIVYELDTDTYYCRANGIYWRYGKTDEPVNVGKLWACLGIDAWPEEVYKAYPDAYRE